MTGEPTTNLLRTPTATYRMQLHRDFSFQSVKALLSYLSSLGVTDVYSSPIFTAAPGSLHGYDICDHNHLNPELGSRDDFDALSDDLTERGMGLLVDFVPNHMGAHSSANPWWRDVLENGPSSLFAGFFDIDWTPVKPELRDKVLLPILGDHYGAVLERGELQLSYNDGSFHLHYFDNDLPINPRQTVRILSHRLEELKAALPPEDGALREFLSVQTALANLPPYTERDPQKSEERSREKETCRERLRTLVSHAASIRSHIDENIRLFNGDVGHPESFDFLHQLLEVQAYRLAYWRTSLDEINYRRFFDINSLAGIRVENDTVFQRVHAGLIDLIKTRRITGLRLDHIDGLHDPQGYLDNLQKAIGGEEPFYVVVEKILSPGEAMPARWSVKGTTGYDFLNELNGLFVDPRNAQSFKKFYARFTGLTTPFEMIAQQSKYLIMVNSMTSELHVLAHALNRLSEQDRRTRDFTLESLRRALREVVADFPLYRTYVGPQGSTEFDEKTIDTALARTRHRIPTMEPTILQFIRDHMLPPTTSTAASLHQRWLEFAMKLQQYTSPVQAKGVEDTAFYRYNLLLSLNEVGGDPQYFGRSADEFHQANAVRQSSHPTGLLATATHDTKRGEDARARVNVLSEMPVVWRQKVVEWSRLNAGNRVQSAREYAPDRNVEYFFYQTLLGVWPADQGDGSVPTGLLDRVNEYLTKAMREAKVHTNWIYNNNPYEDAVRQFASQTLTGPRSQRFLTSFLPFAAQVAWRGALNSLAQTALKMASPGVPDIYQGSELWDLNLADPDNRRPVDFDRRRSLLNDLAPLLDGKISVEEHQAALSDLLRNWKDGRVKLFMTAAALRARRDNADVFLSGDYTPLVVEGSQKDHVVGFSRRVGSKQLIAVVPRWTCSLSGTVEEKWPLSSDVWGDTRLVLPAPVTGGPLTDLFSRTEFSLNGQSSLSVSSVLSRFPAALLLSR